MAKSGLRHNTYLLGTVGDLVNCKKIILFNKKKTTTVTVNDKEVAIPYMSLSNLREIWKILRNSDERPYVEITRTNEANPFSVPTIQTKAINGFYNIIYINSLDDDAVGFTEFFTVQGKEYVSEIRIYLNFTSIINPGIDIDIISPTNRYTLTAQNFIGDDLWNYTSRDKIREKLSGIVGNPHYSTHVSSLISSNYSDFLDSYSIASEDLTAHMLGIRTNTRLSSYSFSFSHQQIGYYWPNDSDGSQLDIVAYQWEGPYYSIVSLTRDDCFGNPMMYTRGLHEEAEGNIQKFSGRYAILEGEDYRIYDTVNKSLLNLDYRSYRYVMDISGRNIAPVKVPILSENDDISEYAPEIRMKSLYYPRSASNLIMKKDSWYIFTDGNSHYIISGIKSAFRVNVEDFGKVYLVNSQTLFMIEEGDEYIELKVYNGSGGYNLDPGDIEGTSYLVRDPEHQYTIDIRTGTNPSVLTQFEEYRRGALPTTMNGFHFFDTLSGLIFYQIGNKINYL